MGLLSHMKMKSMLFKISEICKEAVTKYSDSYYTTFFFQRVAELDCSRTRFESSSTFETNEIFRV